MIHAAFVPRPEPVTTWRMHPDPDVKYRNDKWPQKGPVWEVCADYTCPLQHVVAEPFKPITGQEIHQ